MPARVKTDGTTKTVSFPKKETSFIVHKSLPSFEGFNSAEFCLSPLDFKTGDLANSSRRYEWTQILDDGSEMDCYFEQSYGKVAPNSETEDVLVLLGHYSRNSENPLRFPISKTKILRDLDELKGQNTTSKNSGKQAKKLVAHLDALYEAGISTNALYDRDRKEWFGLKCRVLSYRFKDERGKVRLRQGIEQRVFELDSISFDSYYYEHFLKDAVPFDLGVYFALGKPSAKRIFRYGNKYVQTHGFHSIDLQLFCMSRIGMSPVYVEKYSPSTLASKIRPYARRVSDTELMTVTVERSNTASGYKICFRRGTIQLPLHDSLTSGFSKAEERAFKLLRRNGIFPHPARSIVIQCRKMLGKAAAEYIEYAVRMFQNQYVKPEKLSVPKDKTPGVLRNHVFGKEQHWYYVDFLEWKAEKEKKEYQEEAEKYGQDLAELADNLNLDNPANLFRAGSSTFDLASFQKEHSDTYNRIKTRVIEKYSEPAYSGLYRSTKDLQVAIERSIKSWCVKCWSEFQAGNKSFFPEI